jgi:uncharacterized protein
VKLLIAEPGSDDAFAVWDAADRRVSARVLYAEARSALAAADRAGRVAGRDRAPLRRLLERLWAAVVRIEVDEALVRRAGDLAEDYALRAYDAIHLAAADSVAGDEMYVASADRDLLSAAQARGLSIVSLPA